MVVIKLLWNFLGTAAMNNTNKCIISAAVIPLCHKSYQKCAEFTILYAGFSIYFAKQT